MKVWHDEAQRLERTGHLDQGPCWCAECVAGEIAASIVGPDCRDGKHAACIGDAWDDMTDAPAPCGCPSHATGGKDA
jgi:hypothetical protein